MNRENIQKVRDVIAGLKRERFGMSDWSWNKETGRSATATEMNKRCGTAACIAGWCAALADPNSTAPIDYSAEAIGQGWLGIDSTTAYRLFEPVDINPDYWDRITRAHAVRVLDHLLATGEVDWQGTRRAKPQKTPPAASDKGPGRTP